MSLEPVTRTPTLTTRVAIFCGGRGSATIIREFLRRSNVHLTLLVNAYDDGLSTGALRNFVTGMLGPSDFRKNLSYLLDLYSEEQYAIKTLIELRLPVDFGAREEVGLRRFAADGCLDGLPSALLKSLQKMSPASVGRLRHLLDVFLQYATDKDVPFDFRDCAVGNLIFAGAYLANGNSFNAAAQELAAFVNSQAVLLNVSKGEDRILAAIKADGQLLYREADIVGNQTAVPIIETFFLSRPITSQDWSAVKTLSISEKVAWLRALEAQPALSFEAQEAIEQADIIVYGPGTQHSSLLPSYRIASNTLRSARAPIKAYVVNLGEDNDIQGLSANDLVDRALYYLGDVDNHTKVVTHIFLNDDRSGKLSDVSFDENTVRQAVFREACVIKGKFGIGLSARVHNGYAVVQQLLRISEANGKVDYRPSLDIYIDLYRRAAAVSALLEEFLEIDWPFHFSRTRLRIENLAEPLPALPALIEVETAQHRATFAEIQEVFDWLAQSGADYLVTITGDGEYRLRDVVNGVRILNDSVFGAVYGSRTQSRRQFDSSLRAAYGERSILRRVSALGAFVLSAIFALKFGVIFSDPLTGFRIYRRRNVECLKRLKTGYSLTPTSITKCLVNNKVEIAELPVNYRTFVGFTDPWWRLRRGIVNLFGIVR